jgi:hypothetical protein
MIHAAMTHAGMFMNAKLATRQRVLALALTLVAASLDSRIAAAQASPPTASAATGSSASWVGAPPLSQSLTGPAKGDYDAGRILFEDQDYAGALVKFQRAYDRSGDIRLLWNMAVCEKSLRRYARVLALVDRYWREGEMRMSEAHRREVSDVLTTVRTLISTVHVLVNEAGASVLVDDVPAGTTPLPEPLLIDLGRRRIRVTKPGFEDQQLIQDFAGGSEVTFSLTLVPEPSDGQLKVVAGRSDTISIDGQVVGTGQWEGELPAGEHSLRVAASDMRPYARDVMVEAGKTRTLYVVLEPEESGIPGWVWVGAGVLVAGGLATGGYFVLRPQTVRIAEAEKGTLGQASLR